MDRFSSAEDLELCEIHKLRHTGGCEACAEIEGILAEIRVLGEAATLPPWMTKASVIVAMRLVKEIETLQERVKELETVDIREVSAYEAGLEEGRNE